MDTKEEIKQIAYDFTTSKGDCKKLENRILSLFGVVKSLKDNRTQSFEEWRNSLLTLRYDGKYVHKIIDDLVFTHNDTVEMYQKYNQNL
jgi:hypothetical protein